MATMSPLRRRMIEDMTIRNLSPQTQQSYLRAVAKFSLYFGRSPDRLGVEEVRAYQVHLTSQGVAWSSLNQTVCALRFFYGVTLGCSEVPELIAYARVPRKLPVVLGCEGSSPSLRRFRVGRFGPLSRPDASSVLEFVIANSRDFTRLNSEVETVYSSRSGNLASRS